MASGINGHDVLRRKLFTTSRAQGWCQLCYRDLASLQGKNMQIVHILWVPGSATIRVCTKHFNLIIKETLIMYKEFQVKESSLKKRLKAKARARRRRKR